MSSITLVSKLGNPGSGISLLSATSTDGIVTAADEGVSAASVFGGNPLIVPSFDEPSASKLLVELIGEA